YVLKRIYAVLFGLAQRRSPESASLATVLMISVLFYLNVLTGVMLVSAVAKVHVRWNDVPKLGILAVCGVIPVAFDRYFKTADRGRRALEAYQSTSRAQVRAYQLTTRCYVLATFVSFLTVAQTTLRPA